MLPPQNYSSTSPDAAATGAGDDGRKRFCTRRKILITVPALSLILFAAIFFPVYFTQQHHLSSSSNPKSSTSSSGGSSSGTSGEDPAVIARAKTTPGAVWSQSAKFKDLDDLRIEYYSSGQSNSQVLTGGLPKSAFRSTPPTSGSRRKRRSGGDEQVRRAVLAELGVEMGEVDVDAIVSRRPNKALRRDEVPSPTTTTSKSSTRRSTTTTPASSSISSSPSASPTASPSPFPTGSVLQIYYPANSYTPSELPVGGTQFYALSPFDLSLVQSVTFNYSVFFPEYYNFVMGGKLPGLYGGTEGCGGGNSAQNCWSTRMAWRTNGTGELYAYLPQDKQNVTGLLEVPPYSYVNSDYGM